MLRKIQKSIGVLGIILGGCTIFSNDGSCQSREACNCLLAFKSQSPNFPGYLMVCINVEDKLATTKDICKEYCRNRFSKPDAGPFSACWGERTLHYCNQILKNPDELDHALNQKGCERVTFH